MGYYTNKNLKCVSGFGTGWWAEAGGAMKSLTNVTENQMCLEQTIRDMGFGEATNGVLKESEDMSLGSLLFSTSKFSKSVIRCYMEREKWT